MPLLPPVIKATLFSKFCIKIRFRFQSTYSTDFLVKSLAEFYCLVILSSTLIATERYHWQQPLHCWLITLLCLNLSLIHLPSLF